VEEEEEEEEEEENGVFFTSTSNTLIPFHSQKEAKMLFCKPFTFLFIFLSHCFFGFFLFFLSISLMFPYSFFNTFRIDTW